MQMFSGEVSPHPISARPPHVVRSPYPMFVNTGRRRPPAPRVGPGGTAPACHPLFWIPRSTLIKRSGAVWEMGAALGAVRRSAWLGSGWQGPYQLVRRSSTEARELHRGAAAFHHRAPRPPA